MKKLSEKARLYAKKYGQPPYGREIEGTAELLLQMAAELDKYDKLKEKETPKKPVAYKDTNRADCPVCGATVRGLKEPFGNWCSKCGQALDWS